MTEKPFIYMKCEDGFYDIINTRNHHTYPIGNMEILVMGIVELLNEYAEENEQLKKENMEYYHLVNCGNCKYHNYDWFDDGDEFEVCDKGHTERLIYNKFCEEWREL